MELGTIVLNNVSCPTSGGIDEVTCLRNLPVKTLLAATSLDFPKVPGKMLEMAMPWVPIVTGTDELPMQPQRALLTGQFNKVPVMFGTVANESVQFVYDAEKKPMSGLVYYGMLDLFFGGANISTIDSMYGKLPAKDWSDARLFISPLMTDYLFYCVNRLVGAALTKHVPTYMWLFDYASSLNQWTFGKYMPYCVDNVCHAQDLAFIFNPFTTAKYDNVTANFPMPKPDEDHLARVVQKAWGNFARAGDPNPMLGAPALTWPRFTTEAANAVMNYSIPAAPVYGYRDAECNMWDRFGYTRR